MAVWTGSPALPLLLAGDIPNSASDWAGILAAIHGVSDAWTAFTPVWASFGTLPVLGNGTLTGKYTRSNKLVAFSIELVPGTTTTFGTGEYTFSTPTAIATNSTCAAFLEHNATGFRYAGVSTIDSGGSALNRTIFGTGTAGFTGTVPVTLAAADVFRVAGTYESP